MCIRTYMWLATLDFEVHVSPSPLVHTKKRPMDKRGSFLLCVRAGKAYDLGQVYACCNSEYAIGEVRLTLTSSTRWLSSLGAALQFVLLTDAATPLPMEDDAVSLPIVPPGGIPIFGQTHTNLFVSRGIAKNLEGGGGKGLVLPHVFHQCKNLPTFLREGGFPGNRKPPGYAPGKHVM